MKILKELNKLLARWDSRGGQSGSDKYEDALYFCINELADFIIKHEKKEPEKIREKRTF